MLKFYTDIFKRNKTICEIFYIFDNALRCDTFLNDIINI